MEVFFVFVLEIRLVTDPFWSSDLSLLHTPKQRSEAVLYTKRQIL